MSEDGVNSNPDHSERGDLPRHIAIVMDGNGRWARQRGLPRAAGHRRGVDAVREIISACARRGIEQLTLFAFSSENWRRPEREVSMLMELFLAALEREIAKLHENNIRFRVIGDYGAFGDKIVSRIEEAQALTADNGGLTVNVAANYGGRWDIVQACQALAKEVEQGDLAAADVNEETLQRFVCLADAPEPDLFIRTSGEHRISNFLLWQSAYTELYFTDTLWPDFDGVELDRALDDYRKRQRRFGQTGEQLEEKSHA